MDRADEHCPCRARRRDRQLERLPEGTGIVVDDVAAGLYGMLVMNILLQFGLLSR